MESENWLDRTYKLIGVNNVEKLKNSTVAVFGLGGVGSYVLEALARCGIQNIIIIDKDIVDITNINRQLIATHSTIGKAKVEVSKERILDINPNANVVSINAFVSKDNIVQMLGGKHIDYIIDAIDTVSSKLSIIEYAYNNNIKINCIQNLSKGAIFCQLIVKNATPNCPMKQVYALTV